VLVSGSQSFAVVVNGAATLDAASGSPLVALQVGGTAVTLDSGEMGGVLTVLNGELPAYRTKLDAFVSTLTTQVNGQHTQGVDLVGGGGVPLFDPTKATARDLTVAITDPKIVAAALPGRGALDNSNAAAIADLDLGAKSYRELITTFGVTVSTSKQAAANQSVMAAQVDGSREALSGISVDEEMVNLLAAQRGYEGAARVLTAIDSMLDTLINRTGAR
jgi:flagellar hook-associated protein 1